MAATRLRSQERAPRQADSRDDAYLYMLVVSLVATLVGCIFLFMDYSSFSGKPAPPTIQPITRAADGNLPTPGQQPGAAVVQPGTEGE